jgi:hypothetical protein
MEEVSKFARGCRSKVLRGSKLGEFDSVKKVSVLVDFLGRQIRLRTQRRKAARPQAKRQRKDTAEHADYSENGVLGA